MRVIRQIVLIVFIINLLNGCELRKIEYANNPDRITINSASNWQVEISSIQLKREQSELTLKGAYNNQQIKLPSKESEIKSVHLSYDQKYLVMDIWDENRLSVYVVNLHSGETLHLLEKIGNKDHYMGYDPSMGLAWSPKENIITMIGGYPEGARVYMYHMEMDEGKQDYTASQIYENIYGVKWGKDGKKLYYLVDSLENKIGKTVNSTEIEVEDTLIGGKIEKYELGNEEMINDWLKAEL
ncbi:hypothetical protein AB3U99_15005 [Niallia sp. JL1B1071]|uniref:hypothetical protein n=1 Tax=Niallia tiangongensis TaxID=3237105 RepID=UPI0037DC9921